MKKGFDGARDHHGDLLPELSASASKMKYEKLVNTPLPSFDKDYPGSPERIFSKSVGSAIVSLDTLPSKF